MGRLLEFAEFRLLVIGAYARLLVKRYQIFSNREEQLYENAFWVITYRLWTDRDKI
jgi:hypothetical protein